jgi:uncharacterized protein with HEPN domain
MKRLARPPLLAILSAIEGIEASVAGQSLEEYSNNWLLKHGVERGIEIISEAARRIPPSMQSEKPDIPWKQIMAVGNILRHNYDRIVDRIIYEIVARDLPPLKSTVGEMLAELHETDD